VAATAGLAFRFLQDEHFDFAIPESHWDRPAVVALRELLSDPATVAELGELGFTR
jgi:molybdate-binding protein